MKIFPNILAIILYNIFAVSIGNAQSLPAVCHGEIGQYVADGYPNSVFIWEVEHDSVKVNNYGDTAEIKWDVPSGVYRISVKEVTEYGCEGTPVYAFVEVASPTVDIGDNVELCEGGTYTFDPGNYESFLWHNGSNNPTYMSSATETVWVAVKDQSGCTGWDTAYVIVYENPVLDIGNDTAICGINTVNLDAGEFDFYEWSTGENTRWITAYSGSKTISVEVTDHHGCSGTDSIKILNCDVASVIGKVPNAFTPNGDGQHDTWEVANIELFPDVKVEVFDRWGRLVYVSENGYNNDWDGKSLEGKELPMDTYYYVINFNVDGSEPVVGNITLIR